MKNEITLDSLLASLGDGDGVVKEASEQVAPTTTQSVASTTAQELEKLLTKQAQEVNTEMSNPNQKGKAIADSVLALVKQAMDKSAENQVIQQTAAMQAQSSAGLQETPREGASITNTLQGIVAKGFATGAVRADALDEHMDNGADEGNGGLAPTYSSDGHPTAALPEGEDDDEVEKTAALITLVDNGVDFDTAVSLIKQAEEEILADEYENVKQAAVAGLIEEGMDIESAITLVKQAMYAEEAMAKQANAFTEGAKKYAGKAKEAIQHGWTATKANAAAAKASANQLWQGGAEGARKQALKDLATNPVVYGSAGALAAGGGAAYYMNKKAEIAALMDEGFSATEAVALVKEAEGKMEAFKEGAKAFGKKAIRNPMTSFKDARMYDKIYKDQVAKAGGKAPGKLQQAWDRTKIYADELGPNAALAGGVGLAGYGGYKAMSGEKQAAEAIGYLVDQGYSVQQALDILSNA